MQSGATVWETLPSFILAPLPLDLHDNQRRIYLHRHLSGCICVRFVLSLKSKLRRSEEPRVRHSAVFSIYENWRARLVQKMALQRQCRGDRGPDGPEGKHHKHPWWKVMCLTGVDYFSTLGYQPGIAFLAAGALSPVATLILSCLLFFGALTDLQSRCEREPARRRLDRDARGLLSRWKGKLFVLVLLGFVATDFVITIIPGGVARIHHRLRRATIRS